MCKYCRHLQELRKQDQERYDACIEKWRFYVCKADKLLRSASIELCWLITTYDVRDSDRCDSELLLDSIRSLVSIDCVYDFKGKKK